MCLYLFTVGSWNHCQGAHGQKGNPQQCDPGPCVPPCVFCAGHCSDYLSPVTVNCGLKASGNLNSEYHQIGVHNRASILQQENDFNDLTLPLLFVAKAVPLELSCGDCQKRLLETVGKVIRVIEEQASPGMSSAVKTGSDILNIIGTGTTQATAFW